MKLVKENIFLYLKEEETIAPVSKLTDIVKHLGGDYFAIISAYQKGKDNKENSKATRKLQQKLKAMGSQKVIPLTGEWDRNIPEKSFFVLKPENLSPKSFYKAMQKLSAEFNQESFLYSKAGDIIIVGSDGKIEDIGDDLNVTKSYVGFKFK